jgi:hypothetical protein
MQEGAWVPRLVLAIAGVDDPLFGLFPAFMFWRLRKLRTQPPREQPVSHVALPPEPDKTPLRQEDADDPELAAYNRYLAQLNARHEQETR